MNARVEWDGYNWTAVVEGVPGAVTFAKRLDLLPARVVEVVKLMEGRRVNPSDVQLDVHVPDGEADAIAHEVQDLRQEVDEIRARLANRTPVAVRALRAHGMTMRDIGWLTGLSYQRVHQILHK